MKNKRNIQKIIIGCCKQRPRYQREFVALYSDFLYAICCRYMSDKSSAKDQLQISLMKILQNIETYNQEKGKIESWITRVTINTCLTDLRKRKLNVVSMDDVSFANTSVNPSIIDDMRTEDILALIQSLPDIYREIFNLVEIDGYKHGEIASMLNIKEASSRARLTRAKEMLRIKLTGSNKKKSWINLA
ncbi:sigma-70 family RNA polymerase sigma factor [Saprospiraceae bacterium]|nr:sigma-70 family RNA polymerase sigma factor [Saprospiraceae bacterium]